MLELKESAEEREVSRAKLLELELRLFKLQKEFGKFEKQNHRLEKLYEKAKYNSRYCEEREGYLRNLEFLKAHYRNYFFC